ncbi:MAG: hypothetical protein MG2_0197 [uncultured Candidatus Poseidoniales archaeon]|nr:MAG: hypothetical protein MG2_0197 [uncultured Candidatus Poseidoniales archaeon]
MSKKKVLLTKVKISGTPSSPEQKEMRFAEVIKYLIPLEITFVQDPFQFVIKPKS